MIPSDNAPIRIGHAVDWSELAWRHTCRITTNQGLQKVTNKRGCVSSSTSHAHMSCVANVECYGYSHGGAR